MSLKFFTDTHIAKQVAIILLGLGGVIFYMIMGSPSTNLGYAMVVVLCGLTVLYAGGMNGQLRPIFCFSLTSQVAPL